MSIRANAMPAKNFFLRMITRDISLEDCILDLIDNSIDGATRGQNGAPDLSGRWVNVHLAEKQFLIEDNCRGIPLEVAEKYAFNFGRNPEYDAEEGTIGVYGIGMKRAVFKLGREIEIESSTTEESFRTRIVVDEWAAEPGDDWGFQLEPGEAQEVAGTRIRVSDLNPGVGEDITDPAFETSLIRSVSRDYALFLRRGLHVEVNGKEVPPETYSFLVGDAYQPARVEYQDDGVGVQISAGMAAPPPEDDSASAEIKHHERYGWYVMCNDRVVLAANKTDQTVWNNEGFQGWHNQYNGFLGIAAFESADPGRLPWTTTKRDIDQTHPVYRRAVIRMKKMTDAYIQYTNARKRNVSKARSLEAKTTPRPVSEVPVRAEISLPKIDPQPTVRLANILYARPVEEVRAVAEAMGNKRMSYKRVGEKSFEYYYEREVGEL